MPTASLRQMMKTIACLPAGAHSSDPLLTTWSATRIATTGNRLVAEGKLFKAQLSPRETRFFATPELRDMFVETHKPVANPLRRRGLTWRVVDRAPWADDAEAIVPEGLQIQYGPSHPPRFSEQRFAFVHG